MPLYVYKCEVCSHEFEGLVPYPKRDDPTQCPKCGKGSKRVEATTFGIAVKGGPSGTLTSPKEIDRAVGADAERRWNYIETRRNKRQDGLRKGGLKDVEVPMQKGKDGTFRPVESLGDSKIRGLRREYSDALTAHRAERNKKGEGQFDGPGSIEERK